MTKKPDAQRVYTDIDELLDHEIEARIKASVWKRDKLHVRPRDKLMYAQTRGR